MTSILVTYGTGHGQTAKVAHYVDSAIAERGHDVTTTNVRDVMDTDLDDFDAVLVGGPINNQRQLPEVTEFVERHREALAERPSGFFRLSIASALPYRWAQRGAEASVDDLIEETGWRPDRVGLFGGTVAYTKYDRFTRIGF